MFPFYCIVFLFFKNIFFSYIFFNIFGINPVVFVLAHNRIFFFIFSFLLLLKRTVLFDFFESLLFVAISLLRINAMDLLLYCPHDLELFLFFTSLSLLFCIQQTFFPRNIDPLFGKNFPPYISFFFTYFPFCFASTVKIGI